MNKHFTAALADGALEPILLPDGQPLELLNDQGDLVRYYFAGQDHINLYGQRFMAIADLSRMHSELKLNPEYLKTHNAAIEDLLSSALLWVSTDQKKAVAAISDARTLHSRFQERMSLGMDMEHFYDIVAATCFTEDEDPRGFDQAHNDKKKRHLLKFPDLYDFFLRQPLSRFIPWQVLFDENILSLAMDRAMLEVYDLGLLLRRYTGTSLAPGTVSTIESRTESLQAWISLLMLKSKNIANT